MPPLEDEYEGFDTAAAAADIGSSLFGPAATDDRGHNEGGTGTDLTPGNTDAGLQEETAHGQMKKSRNSTCRKPPLLLLLTPLSLSMGQIPLELFRQPKPPDKTP
jgi:hypothetical protein